MEFLIFIPFILMLASIAVCPMIAGNFWEHNRNKLIVSLVLSVPTIIWLMANSKGAMLEHTIIFDYIPFIVLLGSLFVITGGIFIDANLEATPRNNLLILLTGGILASFMGTTGAAMLLIRLLLHTNEERQRKVHIVLFFIAIVANCGGLLTPLGDPPLFMMYLRGVDFFWFLSLVLPWLFINGMLLLLFYIFDTYHWKRESDEVKKRDLDNKTSLVINGKLNFVWLLIVILAVAFVNPNYFSIMKEYKIATCLRDIILIIAGVMSIVTTSKECREANQFNWEPIKEVAYLFIGIFITMVPVLLFLQENSKSIDINTPGAFYFVTGALSSFLDNTPTAVTFYTLAHSLFSGAAGEMIAGIPNIFMEAICIGAVAFGSITYIGNGPNFMVKSIAEQNGINMPQFFQYMYKFSLIIILPILIIANFIFIG